MKIFVITGSRGFNFDRLVNTVDDADISAAVGVPVECFIQTGSSTYIPKRVEYKNFLSREEFNKRVASADLVITHGGTGAIIGAVKKGKKVIAVPRLMKYCEAVDDHQVELIRQFERMGMIKACFDLSNLTANIVEVLSMNYLPYESGPSAVLNTIDEYIQKYEVQKRKKRVT